MGFRINKAIACLLSGSLGFLAYASNNLWREAESIASHGRPGDEKVRLFIQSSSKDHISLVYQAPALQFAPARLCLLDQACERVLCGNTHLTDNEGEPTVPFVPVRVIVPQGKEISNIEVSFDSEAQIFSNKILAFGLPMRPISSNWVERGAAPNLAIYSSNAPYPGRSFDLVSVQNRGGVSLASVNVFPLTYFPQSNTVHYHPNFTVKFCYQTEDHPDTTLATWVENTPALSLGVENPEELASYRSLQAEEGTYEHHLCSPLEEFSYVVVTNKAISEAKTTPSMADLVAHRQKMGHTAKVVTIESIKSTYRGADEAEKLRNFIKDAYNNWKTKYVFLAGGRQVLPVKKLKCESADIPSDLYFQCLNKDPKDITADVYIGRALAPNEQAMSNLIAKTITYETDDNSKAYLHGAFFCGEHLFDDASHPKEIHDATISMEYIKNKIFATDSSIKFRTLYNTVKKWSTNDIVNEINSNAFSTITHLGHGMPTRVMNISNSDVTKFKNTGPIFAISQACDPGAFDKDCVAEAMTTKTKFGCWGTVLNSRTGWEPQSNDKGQGDTKGIDGPSFRLQAGFWEALFKKGIDTAGAMNAYSHESNIANINKQKQRWTIYESNLLGDPAVKFRLRSK